MNKIFQIHHIILIRAEVIGTVLSISLIWVITAWLVVEAVDRLLK
jgi:Co/Zn/Cd efflux system component